MKLIKGVNKEKLCEAIDFIINKSSTIGLHPRVNEKYLSIRYDAVHTWKIVDRTDSKDNFAYPSISEIRAFEGILWEAVKKYPEIADEIVEDWCNPYTADLTLNWHMWKEISDDEEVN